MSTRDDIQRIEKLVTEAGIKVPDFCRRVPVEYSTWWRWREGKGKPLLETWRRVEAAVEALPREVAP